MFILFAICYFYLLFVCESETSEQSESVKKNDSIIYIYILYMLCQRVSPLRASVSYVLYELGR